MIMSLKQKKVKFNPRMKLNHNTFNPYRRKKHFNVVHWSGPEDDSIFVRTHSYNKLNKIIFISWSDKFYCTLMIMIWTQKILLKIIMKQSWLTFALTENKSEIISANFFLFFLILQPYFHLPLTSELSDNYYKIISDTVLLKIVAREFLSSDISSTNLHNYLIYQAL